MSSPYYSKEIIKELMEQQFDIFEKRMLETINAKTKEYQIDERDEVVIKKNQINRARNIVEEWLAELSGDVIAELNFIDKTTFGYLDCIPKSCGVRIITSSSKEFEKCITLAKNCSKDRPHFEIMKIKKIHQRWIGSEKSFIIDIGTDLKNDALGHCTHSIKKLKPEVFKKSITNFEMFWKMSETELKKQFGSDFSKNIIFQKNTKIRS